MLGDNPKARLPRVRKSTGADNAHPFKKRRWGIGGPQERHGRCSPH